MSASKQWLAGDSDPDHGATGSTSQRVVQEAMVSSTTVEQVGSSMVAEVSNEEVVPNVGRGESAGGERRAMSVLPRPGEKRPWDETSGMDQELETVVLRVLLKYNLQPSSSSSSREMVSQEVQTELSGDAAPLEKVKNKIPDGPSSGNSGDLFPASGSGGNVPQEPRDVPEMHPDEILELEAVIQEEREQENAQLEQLRLASDAFLKGSEAPLVESEWEMHFQDGRPYYYNLATQKCQWECPDDFVDAAGKAMADEPTTDPGKEKGKNKVSVPPLELGSITSRPSSESVRALQGSIDGVENDFPSTNRNSGLKGGSTTLTSGSQEKEGISGQQVEMAGAHLDQQSDKKLSEGDAAVETSVPDKNVPRREEVCASATEEPAVEKKFGTQEVGPEKGKDREEALDVPTEKESLSGASVSISPQQDEASMVAGDAANVSKKDSEAWSANAVRAEVPKDSHDEDGEKVMAHGGTSSATDCDNGEQVVEATDEGDAVVDAPGHSEVSGEELNGHTGANGAAVTDNGGDTPWATMDPKDPAVEERVPAADDTKKDPVDGSDSNQMESLPTGGLPEVDTEQTATEEAEPLAKKDESPESLERKVDDLAGLTQEQDEQLGPESEKKDIPGAEEELPVPVDQAKKEPNEVTPSSSGEILYQPGDTLVGVVNCINTAGVWVAQGKTRVLIPETENSHVFRIGDEVEAMVDYIANDGVTIMKLNLDLVDDPFSSETRRWKRGKEEQWWDHSWYSSQWDQGSSWDSQWDWKEDEWQYHDETPEKTVSDEEMKEAVLRQFYGEKVLEMLGSLDVDEEYRSKITGMIVDLKLEEIKRLVADSAELNIEVQEARRILDKDGWKPDGKAVVQHPRGTYPRAVYHNAMFDLVRAKTIYGEATTGEAVAQILDKGDEESWYKLWMETKTLLQEVQDTVMSTRTREGRPIEHNLDPSKYKKPYVAPRLVSKGYKKLCTYYQKGNCRNGSQCDFEHRIRGEGWPDNNSKGSESGNNADNEEEMMHRKKGRMQPSKPSTAMARERPKVILVTATPRR